MKRLVNFVILWFVALVTFVSCQKEEDPSLVSKVNLAYSEINALWEGGTFEIAYTIDNPQEGSTLKFDNVPEWVVLKQEKESIISLIVAENDLMETRKAVINGSYADQQFTITVFQQERVEKGPFDIQVVETGEGHVVINVIPEDPEVFYLPIVEMYSVYEQYPNDEAFLQGYLSYLQRRAARYMAFLPAYLEAKKLVQQGAIENYTISYLIPGRTYLIGCAAFDKKTNQFVSQMSKVKVDTKAVHLGEPCFTLNTEITGPVIDLEINPFDNSMFYQVALVETEELPASEDLINAIQRSYFETLEYVVDNKIPLEDAINYTAYTGVDTLWWEVKEEVSYCAFVVGIDQQKGFVITEPAAVMVRTEKVSPSDNVFEISVGEITDKTAKINIRTANRDPYVMGTISTEKFQGMNDEEILQEILSGRYQIPKTRRGDFEILGRPLEPNTEYYVVVWGYSGGQATTGLTKKSFVTKGEDSGAAPSYLGNNSQMGNNLDKLLYDWNSGCFTSEKTSLPQLILPTKENIEVDFLLK